MFCVKTLRNGSVEDKTIGNVLPRTTETGRPRIQKYALKLILVPDVNNLVVRSLSAKYTAGSLQT